MQTNNKQSEKPRKFVSRKEFEDLKLDVKNINTGFKYSLVRFAQVDARVNVVEKKQNTSKVIEHAVVASLAALIASITSFFLN